VSYFILPEGVQSHDFEQWKTLRADLTKRWVRRYQNDRFRLEVEWVGGPFSGSTPQEHAAAWRTTLTNIIHTDPEGNPYDAPKEAKDPSEDHTWRTAKEAIDHYENFLVTNHTGCEWVTGGDGKPRFLERGNVLAPPSKDLPAMPPPEQLSPETLAAMGSW
jgi:hypothetical protein